MSRVSFKAVRQVAVGVGLAAGYLLVGSIEASADHKSEPCAKHPVKLTAAARDRGQATRAQCVRQWNRDHKMWPKNPKDWEIKRRIGWHWQKAERVARCETAGNWQHYPNGRYIGGLGMYRSTYGIGQAKTGYRWPHEGATKAEQIAVGYIVAQRFGWRAWGCGGA